MICKETRCTELRVCAVAKYLQKKSVVLFGAAFFSSYLCGLFELFLKLIGGMNYGLDDG